MANRKNKESGEIIFTFSAPKELKLKPKTGINARDRKKIFNDFLFGAIEMIEATLEKKRITDYGFSFSRHQYDVVVPIKDFEDLFRVVDAIGARGLLQKLGKLTKKQPIELSINFTKFN